MFITWSCHEEAEVGVARDAEEHAAEAGRGGDLREEDPERNGRCGEWRRPFITDIITCHLYDNMILHMYIYGYDVLLYNICYIDV